MTRKYIDCREFPSEKNCTVEISANTDDEIMDVAVMHAVTGHQHNDTPELRNQIRGLIRSREEALT
jgi:predicted small metal-binding protein